ncbi:MAG: hypothetical protein ACD_77C00014G0004 [uncultured bacterium]|nr:MAG: hypothetical protein ACD_77C00014G0004 [uncultured bacterium]
MPERVERDKDNHYRIYSNKTELPVLWGNGNKIISLKIEQYGKYEQDNVLVKSLPVS